MIYYRYPVNKIGITSDYGFRNNGNPGFHYGLDLGWFDYQGEEIYSIGNGEVVEKGFTSTAGNYVTIKHSSSDKSSYLHLKEASVINIGDIVSTGTLIGYMGTTGSSTGVHLHFSFMRDGNYIDPKTVLYVYEDQIVGENTQKNYSLLYYTPSLKEDNALSEIEKLKQELIEKDKIIKNMETDYKFKYEVSKNAKYKIKLNKGECLIIK